VNLGELSGSLSSSDGSTSVDWNAASNCFRVDSAYSLSFPRGSMEAEEDPRSSDLLAFSFLTGTRFLAGQGNSEVLQQY
jgi:hypothetical protein